jgi:hypothetical protein
MDHVKDSNWIADSHVITGLNFRKKRRDRFYRGHGERGILANAKSTNCVAVKADVD